MANLRFLGLLILWAAPVLALAGEVDRTMLEGALWRLASVAHADNQLHAVPNSVEATATFANGSVSGSGGCNRYTASYTVANGKLTIGMAASTMMACPEPQADVATMAYQIEDGQLSLLNAGGQKIATFKAWQPVALKGVTWRATVYNNGRAAAVSLIDGSEITATFGTDGVLSGSAGCNHYRAAYVAKDSSMTIQTPASTRKACTQNGLMQQEQEYLKALTTAATYTLQGNQLELRTAQGELAALFKAR